MVSVKGCQNTGGARLVANSTEKGTEEVGQDKVLFVPASRVSVGVASTEIVAVADVVVSPEIAVTRAETW
jgi:hypothetical protein